MRKIFLLASLALFSFSISAQSKFEIGIEGAITNARYRFNDPGDNLRPVAAISGMGGINFRYNLKGSMFLEAAVLATEYGEGMKLKQQVFSSYSNSDVALLMPLRVGFDLPISRRFSMVPIAGFAPALKIESSDGYTSVGTQANTYYEYTSRDSNKEFFTLVQAGLGIEMKLFRKVKAGFSGNYYHGLQTHKIFDVRYQVNGGPVQQATVEGKGSQWAYQFSLRYGFGRV